MSGIDREFVPINHQNEAALVPELAIVLKKTIVTFPGTGVVIIVAKGVVTGVATAAIDLKISISVVKVGVAV